MTFSVSYQNAGPNTIWAKLAAKLGREPTNEEAKAEVRRILREARIEAVAASTGRKRDRLMGFSR